MAFGCAARIEGKLDLYRSNVPFSLTFYDCLFGNGINISHAKLEELDIRNCCSAAIEARGVQVAENVYLLTTAVFGGLDFIDAQIGGDFDFSGGLAFHGTSAADMAKRGVALNFHDAKIGGDVRLGDKFRALGQVRLIGAEVGRSLSCRNARFVGGGQTAIDARSAHVGSHVIFTGQFRADGGVELRRAHIGGDLDCDGGRFIAAPDTDALDADLVNVGGQVNLGDGFHADGEVRLVNAVVGGDVGCNNGHFLHPAGEALTLDGAAIGRSLRIGADASAPHDESKDLPHGFLARGTVRLWNTQVSQDLLANGAQFEAPESVAILACNLHVGSRVDLSGIKAIGCVNLFSADIEHELDLRAASSTPTAPWAILPFGPMACTSVGTCTATKSKAPMECNACGYNGLTSFQFATIAMHWDLSPAPIREPEGRRARRQRLPRRGLREPRQCAHRWSR